MQGFGTLLMEEAERIAREEHGSVKLAVISGRPTIPLIHLLISSSPSRCRDSGLLQETRICTRGPVYEQVANITFFVFLFCDY